MTIHYNSALRQFEVALAGIVIHRAPTRAAAQAWADAQEP